MAAELAQGRRVGAASCLLAVYSASQCTTLGSAWARWAESASAMECEALTVRLAQRDADLRRVKKDTATARESSSELVVRLEAEQDERNARLRETAASSSGDGAGRGDAATLREANEMLDERAREAAGNRVRRLRSLLAGIAAAKQV